MKLNLNLTFLDPFQLNFNLGCGVGVRMALYIKTSFILARNLIGNQPKSLPEKYTSWEMYFFDPKLLTQGDIPVGSGCLICRTIGHKMKDCSLNVHNKRKKRLANIKESFNDMILQSDDMIDSDKSNQSFKATKPSRQLQKKITQRHQAHNKVYDKKKSGSNHKTYDKNQAQSYVQDIPKFPSNIQNQKKKDCDQQGLICTPFTKANPKKQTRMPSYNNSNQYNPMHGNAQNQEKLKQSHHKQNKVQNKKKVDPKNCGQFQSRRFYRKSSNFLIIQKKDKLMNNQVTLDQTQERLNSTQETLVCATLNLSSSPKQSQTSPNPKQRRGQNLERSNCNRQHREHKRVNK